jgi:uncharacterized protein YbaP (TraB family)
MTSVGFPIGINRGYLFGIGKAPHKDYAYVVAHPEYPFDPFVNPKLRKAFDESQVIVSEFQNISNDQELADFFQTLPERLQKTLNPQDLQAIKTLLLPLLDQIPGLKTCQAYDKLKAALSEDQNDAAAVTTLVLFGIVNVLKSQRNRVAELAPQQSLPKINTIQTMDSRAKLLSKQIMPLSSQGDSPTITEVFSLLMQEPELLKAILFALTQKEVAAVLSEANAFERGSYDDDAIPDMTKVKLMRSVFSSVNIDLEKLEKSPTAQQLSALLDLPNISEKIEQFVSDNKRHLFLISRNTLIEWPRGDFPLTQIKIPLKPVGFFWTIQDDIGHESLLMGSMHITAEKLVDFPRKITDLFDSSDAMAVEIDITREDVVKRTDEVSWEKEQAKELQLLSPTEKEQLYTFLKAQYSDLETIVTDDFDEQTQFLVQALRKVACRGFQTAFAGQKDKTTNQSFFSTGIEETLMRRAKERQIPIKDLETFDDHFIKFTSGPASYIPIMNYDNLKKMIETSKMSFEEVLEAHFGHSDLPKTRDELWEWLQKPYLQKMTDTMESGDLDALEVEYLADRDPLQRDNLIQRNRNMALKIDEFIKSGKRHFCIAGAMHMAGPSSILSFLKQSGYKVERLIVEEPLEPELVDDEKELFVQAREVPPNFALEESTELEEPTNPPVISLDTLPNRDHLSWRTLPAFAISQIANIVSWPWRKITGTSA